MRAPDQAPPHDLPDITADLLAQARQRHPRVHCLTNAVAQHFTANVLLSVGATPSMTMSPAEVEHFVRGSGALIASGLTGSMPVSVPMAAYRPGDWRAKAAAPKGRIGAATPAGP